MILLVVDQSGVADGGVELGGESSEPFDSLRRAAAARQR